MDPPSDRSSPERPKRRLSSRPSSKDIVGKRHRTSLDTSPSRSANHAPGPKDPPGVPSEPQLRPAHTPLYPSTTSSPARDVPPPAMAYRQHPYPSSSSAFSPGSSASASDDTALVDDTYQRRLASQYSQYGRLPDVPPPSTAPPSLSGARWITDDQRPYQTQSSSTSSSSSSHRFRPPHLRDSGETQSPPPSLTLSTGQPLVNPPLKTQAAFVGKLYSMLEDADIGKTGLIHWSCGGSTFTCPNPTEFAKTVLPRFFKHNNWQSFVRQLNMYSFNKVNDLHATTTDPMAWEFRHPLFRQGESHLLASIKRKTTRASQNDGPQPFSPSDDVADPRHAAPMAGWMQDADGQASSPIHPPPVALPAQPRPEVFGYNLKTGETIQSRPYEVTTRQSKYLPADMARVPGVRAAASSSQPDRPRPKRAHSDFDHPPVSTHSNRGSAYRTQTPLDHLPSFPLSAYSDTQQYPQPAIPSPSPIMALTSQVAFLEERIAKLSDALSVEMAENVRSHMDMLSYMASITLWLPNAPPQEVSALQDSLNRQKAELRQKYDALIAVDTLAHLADAGASSHNGPTSTAMEETSPMDGTLSGRRPLPRVEPDYHLTSHHPTPRTSPHLAPLIPRRHTGVDLPYTTGPSPLLPQKPATASSALPFPHPSPSRTASFDSPAFSRSPLMHRPASTSNLTTLFNQRTAAPRRPSPVSDTSPAGSTFMMAEDGRESGMADEKAGRAWEEAEGNGDAGTPRAGPAGIRNLLN